jgi:hypothetical protein
LSIVHIEFCQQKSKIDRIPKVIQLPKILWKISFDILIAKLSLPSRSLCLKSVGGVVNRFLQWLRLLCRNSLFPPEC